MNVWRHLRNVRHYRHAAPRQRKWAENVFHIILSQRCGGEERCLFQKNSDWLTPSVPHYTVVAVKCTALIQSLLAQPNRLSQIDCELQSRPHFGGLWAALLAQQVARHIAVIISYIGYK